MGARRGHNVTALGRDAIDFASPALVPRAFSGSGKIDVVINGAAYTKVDQAEAEPERANIVNGESVAVLSDICARRGIPLIHLSTDYVFDGTKPTPYVETDATNPINAYGRSKLMGEEAVRRSHAQHVILRTSWVYASHGTNFVRTMLKLGAERDELRIVDDQHGAPTSAREIALAALDIAEAAERRKADMPWGTYHFTAAGETTWRRFAERIFAESAPWTHIKAKIVPIATAEYPTAARRPLNSCLDCRKIESAFGIGRRPWEDGLKEVLGELRMNARAK